jgi:Leucine-rich repeat (LRR) protein
MLLLANCVNKEASKPGSETQHSQENSSEESIIKSREGEWSETGNYYFNDRYYLRTPDYEELLVVKKIKQLIIAEENPITDISFLENISQLERLSIRNGENIEGFEPLQYLQDLESLSIDSIGDDAIDISPVTHLRKLKYLDIDFKGTIKNIEAIYELTNLKELTLHHRNRNNNGFIINTNGIQYLSELETLTIISSSEIDLTYIGRLPNLDYLQLWSDYVTNINKLKNPELQTFWVCADTMRIKHTINLDWLVPLSNLRNLTIIRANIINVRSLLQLSNLQEIEFLGTPFDPMALLESKSIKKIIINDVDYENFPVEVFEKRGITIGSNYTGDEK